MDNFTLIFLCYYFKYSPRTELQTWLLQSAAWCTACTVVISCAPWPLNLWWRLLPVSSAVTLSPNGMMQGSHALQINHRSSKCCDLFKLLFNLSMQMGMALSLCQLQACEYHTTRAKVCSLPFCCRTWMTLSMTMSLSSRARATLNSARGGLR